MFPRKYRIKMFYAAIFYDKMIQKAFESRLLLMKRAIFIGCGQFGSRGFEYIVNSDKLKARLNIVGVITAAYPGNAGRIVGDMAAALGLPVFSGKISSAEAHSWIESLKPDCGMMMEYIYKIPESIIKLFPYHILNVHSSDLPKYRGGSPLESLIVNGEKLVITVHRVSPQFDDGPWLVKTKSEDIEGLDIESLVRLASIRGAKALEEAVIMLLDGTGEFKEQDNDIASYSWEYNLDKLLEIDWERDTVKDIHRKVLAGGAIHGAGCSLRCRDAVMKLKIVDAYYSICSHSYPPGRVTGKYGSVYKAAARGGFLMISAVRDSSLYCSGSSYESIINCLDQCDKEEIVLI